MKKKNKNKFFKNNNKIVIQNLCIYECRSALIVKKVKEECDQKMKKFYYNIHIC